MHADNLNRPIALTWAAKFIITAIPGPIPWSSPSPALITAVTSYQYDLLNRMGQMTTINGSGAVISQYGYTYSAQDQRDSETTSDLFPNYTSGLVNYTYNNVNELTLL